MGAYKDRKIAKANLKKLVEDRSKVLFIHYSQSRTFDEDYGNISPIITSIVIKSFDNQIDQLFAIHLEADKADIPVDQIQDSYRELELRILNSFNNFAKRHQDCIWVHWEMKNIHFGFEAIKHRYEKIGNNINDYHEIPTNKKQNLKFILESIYGENFVDGPDYLRSLLSRNNGNLANNEYLNIDNESQEFEHKNFTSVINSIDTKVEFIRNATNRLINNKLIVSHKNGLAVFEDLASHPIFTLIGWVATISGTILGIIAIF